MSLKALRDQAAADAERTQLALDSSGNQGVTPDMLKGFARKARERIRLNDGGYRRDHLRALAQRVEESAVAGRWFEHPALVAA